MISASIPPVLEVTGLRKQFGEHVVLASVDLVVPRGSVVSVLGRSGTGKSVFLKCLAGLLRPDAGEVRFENGLVDRLRRRCSLATLRARLLLLRNGRNDRAAAARIDDE